MITGDRVFEQQTTRRFVRIVSVSPPWSFAFWLPDARSLVVGEYGWSSPLLQQSMGTPAVDAGQCNPDSHADTRPIQGAIRVLSRTGGAEGADGVTDDYHAVVEVSGRFDAVPGHNNLGACLAAPATEFSFTYEEDEVFVTKVCQE